MSGILDNQPEFGAAEADDLGVDGVDELGFCIVVGEVIAVGELLVVVAAGEFSRTTDFSLVQTALNP